MTTTALLLALGSAFLHAGWNLLLARTHDVQAATGVMIGVSVLLFAPVAVLIWDVDAVAVPYIAASGVFQLAYGLLLAAGYQRADLSVVYPVARGGAPVLVLVFGVLVLREESSEVQAAGVALVAAGVVLVRGLRNPAWRGVALGLLVAAAIAAYTLVDSRGVEYAHPIPYLVLALTIPAAAYLAWLGPRRLRAELRVSTVVAAAAGFAAYALVLAALQLAPAAPVAAVRETSVVIAVALGALLLDERVGSARAAGAAVVVMGVVLLSL